MLKNFVIVYIVADDITTMTIARVPKSINLSAGDKIACINSSGTEYYGECCCDSFLAKPETMERIFCEFDTSLVMVGRMDYEQVEDAQEEEDREAELEAAYIREVEEDAGED